MSRYILVALALVFLPHASVARAGVADGVYLSALQAAVGQADADASRKQVAELLGRARQAMAEGNLETADSLTARAEGLNVTFGLFHTGDTPKKARRDLEKLRADRGANPPATDPFAGQMPATVASAAPQTSAAPASPPAQLQAGVQAGAIIPLPATGGAEVRVTNVNEPAPFAAPSAIAANDPSRKQRVLELVRQARAALTAGDVRGAEVLAREADALGVPDREFGAQDDRAWLVLMEIEKLQRRGVVQAAADMPAGGGFAGQQAVFDPANDPTKNVPAAAEIGTPTLAPVVEGESRAMQALAAGEEAMRRRDLSAAQNHFKEALANQEELDPVSRQRLQDRLALVGVGEAIAPGRPEAGLMDQAAQAQALQARQVSSEVARLEQQSRQLQETDPAQAQAVLQQARVVVEKSTLDAGTKEMMLRRLDRDAAELQRFVDVNRPRLELTQQNKETQAVLDREQAAKLEMQNKLARLVEEYNVLVEQQRFAEAEVAAKRAQEIAPNEAVTQQLAASSKALRRIFNNAEIGAMKEGAFITQMTSIDASSIANVTTDNPMAFSKNWADLKGRRGPLGGDTRRRSPQELEIEQKLKTPVSLKFANAPLSQVFEKLSAMTGVPIYLDNRGIAAEGVDSSTPITIDISTEISLKSALNLILAEHHLTYVIKNEVLKITSDRLRSEEVYSVTYPVGDLIIPIPNFVPTSRMGLAGALADAQASVSGFGGGLASNAPMNYIAQSAQNNPNVLGQMPIPFAAGGGGPAQSGMQQSVPFGPGGMGGGVQPDFESLIELMTTTIEPETWREAGGTQGEVKSHASTLSLVITQTQAVHEQIEDLLNQLRQLQDLQVTIEVRFITLNDNFYEQIGIDFDLDINDNADVPFQIFGRPDQNAANQINRANFAPANALAKDAGNPPRNVQDRDAMQSATVGMSAPGVFSTDLDIPFAQSTLQAAGTALNNVTSFSALQPGGANLGFAILSDLEAYFFITAVQDDQRSNVLQAPKVTMFNGQQAFVSDTTQRPFVISVTPVVGDFAAAQQPVIAVLNEGTSLSVQAVVSNDRRFVRLTMVPFFSQIGDVTTFTFEGSESSTSSTSSSTATQGPGQQEDNEEEEETITRSGTTVQQPVFAFQTVTTTVSVPDGGTVLLGGIKTMREDRRENGVPLLNKLPYINRLFNNVAIGKTSESLMMMVTPRIIIQSEEEEAIGVTAP